MRNRTGLLIILFLLFWVFPGRTALCQDRGKGPGPPGNDSLTLMDAAICEDMEGGEPKARGVVFSVTRGRIFCFTSFDPVPAGTSIYHKWYHRQILSTRIKLTLKTPRWSTVSGIQLRDEDKGPWRVEVTDENGRLFCLLRFSITD